MIIIATGVTENYLPKAMPFLESLEKYIDTPKILIGYGFKPNVKGIIGLPLMTDLDKELTPTKCLQHGAFVDALPKSTDAKTNPIIMFSDGDVIVQRSFTQEETDWCHSFQDGDIGLNYNNPNGMRLIDELRYMNVARPVEEVLEYYRNFDLKGICWNTGNIVATYNTWCILRKYYVEMFNYIDSAMEHYAKQQFLISMIANKHLNIKIMPRTIHQHGCWGFPHNTYRNEKNEIYVGHDKLMFAHNFEWLK